jgi:hypothetical protein
MRWKNIDELINGAGDITVGRIGPIRCVAVAADEDRQHVALVRGSRGSLEGLLSRLDASIEKAWEDDEATDDINGEQRSNLCVAGDLLRG